MDNYEMSIHGKLTASGEDIAPGCTDCHGEHEILTKNNADSPTFSMNIPELCGKCHDKGEAAA
ncbi:MAG: cytochrome c3 family protein [Bacteroidales bacterium]|nr:cytochrome c3 family protein [Bacteroidales bacterium]